MNLPEISDFVSETQENANFLKKLFYPRIKIFLWVGLLGLLVAIRLIVV
ncbi:MAG: hypothetical protein HY781_05820 [Chloroflexi bacterium]|nr:hypothetical protein [Chloroflexota bacterium]